MSAIEIIGAIVASGILILFMFYDNAPEPPKHENAIASSAEDTSPYPVSNASYSELDSEIGCDSKYSDDKKEDIFNSQYKNHWMTWSGEVVLAEADNVSLDIDGKGTQDLRVDFADKNAGYNLTKKNMIKVKFIMKTAGGCFLPFSGEHAVVSVAEHPQVPTQITWTPSFDCAKASTEPERLICTNKELSEADVKLSQAYKVAMNSSPDIETLKKEQNTWRKSIRDACADVTCLNEAYQQRISQLSR